MIAELLERVQQRFSWDTEIVGHEQSKTKLCTNIAYAYVDGHAKGKEVTRNMWVCHIRAWYTRACTSKSMRTSLLRCAMVLILNVSRS